MDDCRYHARELVIELGDEFGPAALAVLDVLKAESKLQLGTDHAGIVRLGFGMVSRDSFTRDVPLVRTLIERAGEIGVLDDLNVDDDGRRFSFRLSGWAADQRTGAAAKRKADQRARERDNGEEVTPGRDNTPQERDTEGSSHAPYAREESREEENRQSASHSPGGPAKKPPVKTVDQDRLPDDLPAHLHPVVDAVLPRLLAVQDIRGGNVPTRRGVALAIRSHPDRDHLTVANDVEHWATAGRGQNQRVIDWARTYRTFLERTPAGSAPRPAGAGPGPLVPLPAERRDEAEAKWAEITGRIEAQMEPETYDLWIAPLVPLAMDGDRLIVGAPRGIRSRVSTRVLPALNLDIDLRDIPDPQRTAAA